MIIETICDSCIKAVRVAGYNESTIFNYEGVIRRFKKFCIERDVIAYSRDIGEQYAMMLTARKQRNVAKIDIIGV